MKGFAYIITLFATSLKASLALRGSFVLNTVFMAVNDFIMFANFWILFHKVESIGGWKLRECALLWGISALGYGITVVLFAGGRRVSRYVILGELDIYLTQPRPPLLQILASHSAAAGWGDVLAGAVLLWASGYITLWSLPLLLTVIACGVVILASCALLAHSLAFWAGDVREFGDMLWEFLVAFSTYPDPIYSGLLRLALFSILPAGFIALLPVDIVRAPEWGKVALLAAATLFYALLAYWVFERGLRRYASGSAMQVRG